MAKPLTPAELRDEAARLEAEADDIERRARVEAAGLRVIAAEFRDAAAKGLTIAVEYAKVRTMSQPGLIDELKKSRTVGRRISGKHALQVGLRRNGMTMTELARVLNVERHIVKSWLVQRIPEAMAKRIETLLGVPATAKSWPAGIRA